MKQSKLTRFYATITVAVAMGLIVPFADKLAVSDTSPTYTHFLYMMGHANWLHWAINAWTLLVLHNLFRWYRVAAAYAVAVGISYWLLPAMPMVGASVFTCFFIGFTMPYHWAKSRLTVVLTVALLILTCVLPHFAGIQHVTSFIVGLVFAFGEYYFDVIKRDLKR